MNIGRAIAAMKTGQKCRRAGWIDRDRWVTWEPPSSSDCGWFQSQANRDYLASVEGVVEVWSYFTMKKPDGGIMPGWSPTQSDLAADDWYIVPANGPDPYARTYTKP